MCVQPANPKALKLFAREIAQAATGMAPGFTGYFGTGRPEPQMVPKLFSTLVAKDRVPIEVAIGEDRFAVVVPRPGGHRSAVHTSALQSLMRTSYAVLRLNKQPHTRPPVTHPHLKNRNTTPP